jgi:hypothetical protein
VQLRFEYSLPPADGSGFDGDLGPRFYVKTSDPLKRFLRLVFSKDLTDDESLHWRLQNECWGFGLYVLIIDWEKKGKRRLL